MNNYGALNPANFSLPKIPDIKDHNLADEFHRRLVDYVEAFENKLTDHEQIALKLVSFGETVTIIVEDIGYWNPSLISFYGKNMNDERVQLIQHISQISFLLIAIKVAEPVAPRRRIGFRLKHELEDEEKKID